MHVPEVVGKCRDLIGPAVSSGKQGGDYMFIKYMGKTKGLINSLEEQKDYMECKFHIVHIVPPRGYFIYG